MVMRTRNTMLCIAQTISCDGGGHRPRHGLVKGWDHSSIGQYNLQVGNENKVETKKQDT